MTKGNTRIRWTEDERNSVLVAYRALHAREPHGDIAKRFASAQKTLLPKRRRTLDYTLRLWLQSDGAHARGRPPAAKGGGNPPIQAPESSTHKTPVPPEPSAKSGSISAAVPPSVTPSRNGARATRSAAPDSAALQKLLVERGSEIVADILGRERVQHALRALLRAAWPTSTSSAPASVPRAGEGSAATEDEPTVNAAPANGKLRILIAGMDKSERALLAKTYDDTLALACWSAEEGLERLRTAVDCADVVVGMKSAMRVSSSVSRRVASARTSRAIPGTPLSPSSRISGRLRRSRSSPSPMTTPYLPSRPRSRLASAVVSFTSPWRSRWTTSRPLLDRFEGYEAHVGSTDGFTYRCGVVGIVLASLPIRFNELGRHDPWSMTEPEQLSGPVLCSRAGFRST